MLLQAGYAHAPYSSRERIIEHSKEGDYFAVRQTQTTRHTDKPNWQPCLLFFLRALQQQKRRLAEKIEREKRALGTLPELAVQIPDYAQAPSRVTSRDRVREHGASPNTVKATFRTIVTNELLVRQGAGRSIGYSLP